MAWSKLTPASETWSRLSVLPEYWSRSGAVTTETTIVVSVATVLTASVGTSGLILRDDFNRSDSTLIGNGWTDDEYGASARADIVSNQAECCADLFHTAGGMRSVPSLASDLLVQFSANWAGDRGDYSPAIAVYWNGVPVHTLGDCYTLDYNAESENLNLRAWTSGSATQSDWTGWSAHTSALRLVGGMTSEGTLTLCGYASALSAVSDTPGSFILRVQSAYTVPKSGASYGFFWSNASGYADNWLACGSVITVGSVDTGYSYRLGSFDTVAGTGSAITHSVNTWPLPQPGFYVYDSSGDTVASLETDIYGGDYIDVSLTSASTTTATSVVTTSYSGVTGVPKTYSGVGAVEYLPTRMKPFPDGQGGVDFVPTVQTPKTFLVSSDRPVNIASRSAISSNLTAEGRP